MVWNNNRQRYWTALLSLCICICIGAIGLVGVFAGDSDAVYAFNSSNMTDANTVSVGELLWTDTYDADDDGAKVFNKIQFDKLIDAMRSGSEQHTAIANLSNKNAGDLRAINGGKDIVVTIDDKPWTVTDLRKLADGRVIATMWLATGAETSQWNKWETDTPTAAYPSNMYSTSQCIEQRRVRIRRDARRDDIDGSRTKCESQICKVYNGCRYIGRA